MKPMPVGPIILCQAKILLLLYALALGGCEAPVETGRAPDREAAAPSVAARPAPSIQVPVAADLAHAWLTREPWQPTADPANGRVWHVAHNGADDNSGTAEHPFATVGRALKQAAGDGGLIRIGPGTFNEALHIEDGGTAEQPLILEGTRGANGEYLTTLGAGQGVDPDSWEAAFDIGPNVYRNTGFPYEPALLTVDGRYVAHIHRDNYTRRRGKVDGDRPWHASHAYGQPLAMLAWPEEQTVHTYSAHAVEIPFFETLGAVYAHDSDPATGVTYLRIAGGAHPRDHAVSISPGGAVIHIQQASHVHLRGLNIERGELGVHVEGANARHNVIDDCHIRHGRIRVLISYKAAHTTVKNSHLDIAFYGTRPGAWGGHNPATARRAYVYDFFKRLAGSGSGSDDRAVRVQNGALYTTVENNHLDGGLVAVTSTSNTGLVVRGNLIHDFSSVGLSIITGSMDAHFHDNLIFNCNKNIRLHRLNQDGGHRVFIYRNLLLQPDDFGDHIFTHAMTEDQLAGMGIEAYAEPEIAIYQNTFIGGHRFFVKTSRMRHGVPQFRFINNIITTQEPFHRLGEDSVVGVFDYNWIVFPADAGSHRPAWFGAHNINAADQPPLWTDGGASGFYPPPPVRGKGIDLSRPFTIGGVTYKPLPGMEPGYFSGERPALGAIQ